MRQRYSPLVTYILYPFVLLQGMGAHGGAVGLGNALQARRLWVFSPMVSLEFFIDTILPATLWPWG